MADLNKVQLIGRLGADPERRGQAGEGGVARLRIATSYRRRHGQSERDETDWHDVVLFGALADTCCQYLTKGRLVYVEGRLGASNWTSSDGQKRTRREVVASRVDFLSAPARSSQGVEAHVS